MVSQPNRGHVVVQLVQNLDYYGVEGQDHTTVVGPPSVSLVCRGNIGIALQISDFVDEDTWIVNSGTFDHMTYDRLYFTHLSSSIVSSVTDANGEALPVLANSLTYTS